MDSGGGRSEFRLNTMITVWYPVEESASSTAKKQVRQLYKAHRCQVKRASNAQGMLLDHIDLDDDHPKKESWLGHTDGNWLIGDWAGYSSKASAQQMQQSQRADAIRLSVKASELRENAAQVARVMRKQEIARSSHREHELELFRIARRGTCQELSALLRRGVNVHAVEPAYQGSPLMEAAAYNSHEVVVRLLHAMQGDAPDASHVLLETMPGGFTVLHWAAMNNIGARGKGVVRALLHAQADPDVRTKNGDTALDLAMRFKNDEVVQILDTALY